MPKRKYIGEDGLIGRINLSLDKKANKKEAVKAAKRDLPKYVVKKVVSHEGHTRKYDVYGHPK